MQKVLLIVPLARVCILKYLMAHFYLWQTKEDVAALE